MLDMPRPRKPYTHRETTRHGGVVWYFRKGKGPRIRLHGDYESPEWLADYADALLGVVRYQQSTEWANLAEATKRQRKSVLNRVLAENMSTPLDAIDREAIIDARDARADTPFAAIDFVKTMRALYKWGTEAGHVD